MHFTSCFCCRYSFHHPLSITFFGCSVSLFIWLYLAFLYNNPNYSRWWFCLFHRVPCTIVYCTSKFCGYMVDINVYCPSIYFGQAFKGRWHSVAPTSIGFYRIFSPPFSCSRVLLGDCDGDYFGIEKSVAKNGGAGSGWAESGGAELGCGYPQRL
jgi:hypothetical protein